MFQVASIHVYPLKSAQGLSPTEALATPEGFRWDRRWMLVDARGAFLTQRGHPSLARVGVSLVARPDGGVPDLELAVPRKGGGSDGVRVISEGASGPRVRVEIWGEHVVAQPVSDAADRLFSDFLGCDARLVFFPDDVVRPCSTDYAKVGDKVAFADGFPYLVTTTGALGAVSEAVGKTLEMQRFRPNIVVAADAAFAEDDWRVIRIAGLPMRLVKPCGRCVMVNVDPATGVPGREPLRTLTRTRRFGSKIVFGQNGVFDGFGVVKVGDPVEVVAWAPQPHD